jgi:hypothetical protein
MSNLSPQAWAVLNAAYQAPDDGNATRQSVAAALRAAADEVVPLSYEDVWTNGRMLQYEKRDPVREQLLAIATELENQ